MFVNHFFAIQWLSIYHIIIIMLDNKRKKKFELHTHIHTHKNTHSTCNQKKHTDNDE